MFASIVHTAGTVRSGLSRVRVIVNKDTGSELLATDNTYGSSGTLPVGEMAVNINGCQSNNNVDLSGFWGGDPLRPEVCRFPPPPPKLQLKLQLFSLS